MRKRSIAVIVAAVLAGVGVPAAAAAGSPVSHVLVWRNHAGTVLCGVEANWAQKPTPHELQPIYVLCDASEIPRQWPATFPVGPNVEIAKTGKARIVPISQWSYQQPNPRKTATLANGASWRRLGITCKIKRDIVTCTNAADHGFTIGNEKYKSF